MKLVNENLEAKVKYLTSNFEKSNTQLHSFMSGTQKLDNLLEMNKPAENRHGLGYIQNGNTIASTSKTTFVPAVKKLGMLLILNPRVRMF